MNVNALIILFITMISAQVWGQIDLPENSNTMTVANDSTKDSGDKAAAINAETAQDTAQIGSALNATGTGILAATCPTYRGCARSGWVMIGMGVLSFMQSAANSGTSFDASQFASQFDGGLGSSGNSAYKLGVKLPDLTQKLKDEIDKNPHVKVDYQNGTLTTKDGDTHKLSDFSSPEAMAAAGFSPDDINAAMKKAKELEAKYVTKYKANELGFEGGSGGGISSLSGSSDFAMDPSLGAKGIGLGNGLSDEDMRLPANQMAGMQKDFNGDPIGVSADSIFLMMNRRYEVKKKQDSFFEEHQVKNRK